MVLKKCFKSLFVTTKKIIKLVILAIKCVLLSCVVFLHIYFCWAEDSGNTEKREQESRACLNVNTYESFTTQNKGQY